jgi:hypothetical protein
VGTDDCQVGHANLLFGPVLDKAHALNTALIAWKLSANIAQETAIDFINDLELPGQHVFKPGYRPPLESFRQQGMIRVRQCVLCDAPGFVPSKLLLVNQDSHQLRNGQSRMSIVHLNCNFVCKQTPVRVAGPEAAYRIRQ